VPKDSLPLREALLACLPSLEIERPLAESGQRVVYLARFDDSQIPSDVTLPDGADPDEKPFLHGWQAWGDIVVKVVAGASTETIARLQAEADILEEVRPANFPKLLYCNLFIENPVTEERLLDRLYVTVEEFIVSRPLSDLLVDYRGQEARTVEVALGIANALMPLWQHPKKFVHRDIKPANVLIRRNGEVVVIDLGIVRETGAKGLTATGWGNAPLTPGYAAPEQIANDKVSISFKSDFFSIGVLMYVLMSGVNPFEHRAGMDDQDVLMATRHHQPKVLSDLAKVSPAFSDFVMKALQKEPFRRHRTPAIFAEELQALLPSTAQQN